MLLAFSSTYGYIKGEATMIAPIPRFNMIRKVRPFSVEFPPFWSVVQGTIIVMFLLYTCPYGAYCWMSWMAQ